MRKVLVGLIIIFLASTSLSEVDALEVKNELNKIESIKFQSDNNLYNDVLQLIGTEVNIDEISHDEFYDNRDLNYSKTYSSTRWDKYSTYYFYNQLDSELKNFWDDMFNECINIGEGEEELSSDVTSYVYIDENISSEKIRFILTAFRISNPQFYFLNTSYSYGYNGNQGVAVAMGIYDNFKTTKVRKNATTDFFTQIDSWESIINSQKNEFDKAIKVHEIVTQKVDYFDELFDDGVLTVDEDELYYTQSAYSVVCSDKTVCAGYSQAYTLLCNAVGVDAISVTGSSHQWNKIRVNDSWYNVDCTWDDNNYSITPYYYCFMKNDDYMENNLSSHIMYSMWQGYVPKCLLDTGSTYLNIGCLPDASGTVQTPIITVERIDGSYMIYISTDTSDATIYYTTDGTNPSQASSKSNIYIEPFKVYDYNYVKAVAVKNTYMDSEVVNGKECIPTPYKITYILGGGINDISNPNFYDKESEKIELKDAYRNGYVFMGWYLDKEYTNRIYTIRKENSGDLTLYAKWQVQLEKPVLSDIELLSNGAKVNWKQVSGASKYRVYRKSQGQNWKKLGDTTNISYLDNNVVSGTTYIYTVRCISDDGTKYLSSYDANGVKVCYCNQPQILYAKHSGNAVNVCWKAVSGASKYRLFRKTINGKWQKVIDINSTNYLDSTVISGTTYIYTVRCISGDSKNYESSFDANGVKITYCSQPVLISLTKSKNGIRLEWKSVSGASKYRVFRKINGSGWTKVADTISLNYTDNNVSEGTQYIYTVRCVSNNGKEYQSSYETEGMKIKY